VNRRVALSLSAPNEELEQGAHRRRFTKRDGVNDMLESRLRFGDAGLWLDVGRRKKERKAPTNEGESWPRPGSGSSIRSTARAPISTGREDWCVRRWRGAPLFSFFLGASPVLGAVFAPASNEFSLRRGAGRTRKRGVCVGHATPGIDLDFSEWTGQTQSRGATAGPPSPENHAARDRIAALHCAGSRRGSRDAAFAGGQSRDWPLPRPI